MKILRGGGGLQKFLDTRKGDSEKIRGISENFYTSEPTGGGGTPKKLHGSYTFSSQKFKDFSRTFQDPTWKFQGLFLMTILPQNQEKCFC